MSNLLELKLPRLATIDETVLFLEKSAKELNIKNCLTAYRLRELALSNQIVHVRAGKKILINIDKLFVFLNAGSTSEPESETNSKYKTISRIEV